MQNHPANERPPGNRGIDRDGDSEREFFAVGIGIEINPVVSWGIDSDTDPDGLLVGVGILMLGKHQATAS
ncbi:MAG TPA: hypothetical protein PKC67_15830 [Kiritimatiellia bacterium]|nr:hypothetical protein [Kiritimatiellia bacterium]HMP35805.1 hypothetical protein [Kiritimatiellia bacterium]